MNAVLVLALLVLAGLVAPRLTRVTPRLTQLPLLHAAGLPLLLLGVVLGPVSGVLDDGVLRALAPVMALALGWTGAALGSRFQWRFLKRIPRALWTRAATQAGAVFLAVAGGTALLAIAVPALRAVWRPLVPVGLALGAVAAVSEPTGQRLTRAFRTGATLETAIGILAFTIALALDRPGAGPVAAVGWLVLALASGAVVGIVFVGLAHLHEPDSGPLAPLGAVMFGAGAAYAAGLSPFVVCAVAAGVVANRSPERRAVAAQLEAWEPVTSAVLLILAGALLGLRNWWLVPAAVVLAGARTAVRWTVGRVTKRASAGIAQGSVALALGIDFLLISRDHGTAAPNAVLTTIVIGVMLARLAALRPRELTASPAPAEVS